MPAGIAIKKPRFPSKVNTKIVGTTFEGRQEKLKLCEQQGIQVLSLRRDYTNQYDPEAVAVEAKVKSNNEEEETIQLGYLSNSDRMCIVCCRMMDGAQFSRSRTVKCPQCSEHFIYSKAGDVACPKCGTHFKTENAKVVTCPTCYGDDWVRDGLASVISKAMQAGIQYSVRVTAYTGGDLDSKGKQKTRGCNILIEQLEKDKPV